jgi:putative transposase
MGEIDKIYTKCPFYGWPRITKQLYRNGYPVNHKRVYRLMKIMGIEGICPKKNLSKPNKDHEVYPYLLNGLNIIRPNQVWSVDITYVRLNGDWLYLFAVLDWFSRYILAWELSDSLSSDFCCETLKKALKINIPDIHNSDQGSQLTAKEYLNILKSHPEIKISMDGRGRAFDNIFIERLWRTIKYEEVYLKDYQTPKEARLSLSEFINFYNEERLHKSLNYQTPAEIYFKKDC